MTSEKTREKLRRWSRFFTILGLAAALVALSAFAWTMGGRARAAHRPAAAVSAAALPLSGQARLAVEKTGA